MPAPRHPRFRRPARLLDVSVTGLLLAVVAAVFYGVASILQAIGMRPGSAGRSGRSGGRRPERQGVARMVTSPAYLGGLGADTVGWLASLVAIRLLPLFAVQAVLATSLAVTALLASVVLHATLRRADLGAVVVAIAACSLTASAAGRENAVPANRGLVAGLVVATVVLAGVGALLSLRRAAAWALAFVAGLLFSVEVVSARAFSLTGVSAGHPLDALERLVAQPLVWTLAAAGAAGVILYGLALERGSVAVCTALLWVVEIIGPTVVGLTVLGDSVRAGWLLPMAVGLAGAIGAAVVLARSPAQV